VAVLTTCKRKIHGNEITGEVKQAWMELSGSIFPFSPLTDGGRILRADTSRRSLCGIKKVKKSKTSQYTYLRLPISKMMRTIPSADAGRSVIVCLTSYTAKGPEDVDWPLRLDRRNLQLLHSLRAPSSPGGNRSPVRRAI
jgi:hypothetical protein